MGRIVRLTESEFHRLVKRLVRETQEEIATKEVGEGWFGDMGRGIKKFTTGYGADEDFESAKNAFMSKLEEYDIEVEENPNDFAGGNDWGRFRQMLIDKATENKFLGTLSKRLNRNGDKYFIVYFPGVTGLQQMGSGAAGGVRSGFSATKSNESVQRRRSLR